MAVVKVLRITTVPISLQILLRGQMRFLKENGFDILMCSSGGECIDEIVEYEQCPHKIIPLKRTISPLSDLDVLWKLIKVIKEFKPDIVHTHTPKAGLIGMMAAWLTKTPNRLHTVAGIPAMESKGLKKKILLFFEKVTYFFATRALPNSKNLLKYIKTNIYKNENKLKVIGNGSSNGIDLEYFCKKDKLYDEVNRKKEQLGITKEDFVFLFVGRIVSDKGINELVEAFNLLCNDYKNIKLIMVGHQETDLYPLKEKTIEILKRNKKILLTGFQKDVRPFFLLSDVFVFPSYREGFPNVVMQSGAMGIPAIVTNINGSNEIIIDSFNGLIVEKKNTIDLRKAMEKLMLDRKFLKKISKNTRPLIKKNFCQRYVWNEILKEYKSHLTNV